jgi:hypothetical protein
MDEVSQEKAATLAEPAAGQLLLIYAALPLAYVNLTPIFRVAGFLECIPDRSGVLV